MSVLIGDTRACGKGAAGTPRGRWIREKDVLYARGGNGEEGWGFGDWSPGWFHEVGPESREARSRNQWLLAGPEAALFS